MVKRLRFHVLMGLMLVLMTNVYAQAPLPPANLVVRAGLDGGAVLRWGSTANTIGYKVYRAIDAAPFELYGEVFHREFIDWYVFPGRVFHYYVTAANLHGESGPSDTVDFHFEADHPKPHQGVITGRVIDSLSGLPIQNAVVRFFTNAGMWTERTHTDSGGVYWVPLDTGNYIVQARAVNYFDEWFNNVKRLENATVIHLHQDTVTAGFAMHLVPQPIPVTVTGTVTDSVTGLGIPNAFVAFLRPLRYLRELEAITGIFGGFPFERCILPELGELQGAVWFGRTDSSGNYTAHFISDQHIRYIAIAVKAGYIEKFYNNKYSPLDANRLFLNHDTSGINFALLPNPNAVNTLSGTVSDSAGDGVPSFLMLFRKTIFGRYPVRFRMTDSLGNFEFFHLVAGIFYIKALPVSDYAPAWYSQPACGVYNWKNADSISVSGNISGIDICVGPASVSGCGGIAGEVVLGGGNSPLAKKTSTASSGLQGVTVLAVSNTTGQVVGYDVTEDDGSYSIEDVAADSYQIVIDKVGYSAGSVPTFTIADTNNYHVSNTSLTVSPDVTTGVVDGKRNLPAEFRLDQNYPNPFNPSTQIHFDIPKASLINLRVYNLIGQEVAVITNTTFGAGSYTVKWNGADFYGNSVSSGVYLFKLVATPLDGRESQFTQVRKMMLMK